MAGPGKVVLASALVSLCTALACRDVDAPTAPVDRQCEASSVLSTTTQPNIVVIMTDDQRVDQAAAIMPLLRKDVADSGVVFRHGLHTIPICCPSRATFYSGQAQHTHGVLDNYGPQSGAPAFADGSTLATELHAAGYLTALIGKYLNDNLALGPLYVPPGWDEWRAFKEGGPGSPFVTRYYNYTLVERPFGGTAAESTYGSSEAHYSTRVLRRKALDFLRRAPPAQPVFLVVTPYAPHTAVSVLSQESGSCSQYTFTHAQSVNEADVSDKPAYVQARPLLTDQQNTGSLASRRKQCQALQTVDKLVHDVIFTLRASGRLANTLFIFTSDNGFLWGEHRLKNRKHAVYLEASTAPLLIRGPNVAQGVVDSSLVHMADLTATIREVAGVGPGPFQHGRSLVPLLAAPNQPWSDDVLIENLVVSPANERFTALRTQDYLYAEYPEGGPGGTPFAELYDLRADPWQMDNIASRADMSATVQALAARLAARRSSP